MVTPLVFNALSVEGPLICDVAIGLYRGLLPKLDVIGLVSSVEGAGGSVVVIWGWCSERGGPTGLSLLCSCAAGPDIAVLYGVRYRYSRSLIPWNGS